MSFYWTITTLNTVGYGDITPYSESEMIYASFVMLVAIWLFTSIVANIADTVEMVSYTKRMTTRFLNEVKTWSHSRELPARLNKPVEGQMHFIVGSSVSLIAIERSILRELPLQLRNELCLHLYTPILWACPFFRGRSQSFISRIAMKLVPLHLTTQSYVYTPVDSCDDIYFVTKGEVTLFDRAEAGRIDQKITVVEEGGWFGLLSLLGSTSTWSESAMAVRGPALHVRAPCCLASLV